MPAVSIFPKRFLRLAAIVLACLVVDQISKWIILEHVMQPPRLIEITSFFNLTLGFNPGVSFGFFKETLAEWPGLLTGFKVLVAAGLVVWAVYSPQRYEQIGLALISGGALGNAFDRWRQGAVTDFLDFHWGAWHWPTFNMADVAIVVGAALMMLCAFVPSQRLPTNQAKLAPDSSRAP
jgi:signal peptidase II